MAQAKPARITHGTPCKHCERPMRHRNTPYTSAPDTVIHSSKGECVSCAKAIRAGREPLKPATPGETRARQAGRHRKVEIGTPCKHCKRPMRPKTVPPQDAPGTIIHGAKGACQTCWKAVHDGRDPLASRALPQEYRKCVDCNRPMRPAGRKLADHPGTVCHASKGRCSSCNDKRRKRHGKTRRPGVIDIGTPCKGCGTPLRPKRISEDDAPGTIPARSNGFCEPCWLDGSKLEHAPGDRAVRTALKSTPAQLEQFRRRHRLPARPAGLTPEELKTRLAIEEMIRERRRRGVPAEGILPESEREEAA